MVDKSGKEIVSGRALLCLDAPAAALAMRRQLYGKSALFHQLKQLQRIGYAEVAIAVESIPAGLPALLDRLSLEGLQICLLRSGTDVAAFAAGQCDILVKDGSIWVGDDIFGQLSRCEGGQIAVVPEDPMLGAFERIDLNRRWAGIAMLDAALLRQSANLPDGWSLASFLLRCAVQAGYRDVNIDIHGTPTALQHLSTAHVAELERAVRPKRIAVGLVDRALFALADRAVAKWGASAWYGPAASCSFPVLALLSLVTAFFNASTASYSLFFLSVLASAWRRHILLVEYKTDANDALALGSSALLLIALILQLQVETSSSDALFLTVTAAGLFWLQQRMAPPSRLQIEISAVPLSAIWVLGHFAGLGPWALKAVIIAILASLLVPPRLNPN